ncbi:MAG: hypothetical protein EP340_01305 [Alphaproteobacteria bacterium]|nr:MAG: hypothetical protein EP340_01305 [Alphaproteobacteria bacterium]
MLKKVAIGIVGVIVLALVVAMLMPGSMQVERSVVIAASKDRVHKELNSYQTFNDWSPWATLDPNATYTYEGPVSGVGARMTWLGNKDVGSGHQEIVASTPDRIDVRLEFTGMGGGDSYFLLSAVEGGTEVTWGFYAEHGLNPINRAMGPIASIYVGRDYQQGLENLKGLIEGQP